MFEIKASHMHLVILVSDHMFTSQPTSVLPELVEFINVSPVHLIVQVIQ
jgi:hypothetical protein